MLVFRWYYVYWCIWNIVLLKFEISIDIDIMPQILSDIQLL